MIVTIILRGVNKKNVQYFLLVFLSIAPFFADFYCATTQTGTLGRLGNHGLNRLQKPWTKILLVVNVGSLEVTSVNLKKAGMASRNIVI